MAAGERELVRRDRLLVERNQRLALQAATQQLEEREAQADRLTTQWHRGMVGANCKTEAMLHEISEVQARGRKAEEARESPRALREEVVALRARLRKAENSSVGLVHSDPSMVWRLAWRRARDQVHDLEGLLAAARLETREVLVGWKRQIGTSPAWRQLAWRAGTQ